MQNKLADIYIDGFEDILDEFSIIFDFVKLLYKKIWGILFFFLEDKALFKETQPNLLKKLYNSIIKVFNNATTDILFRQELK